MVEAEPGPYRKPARGRRSAGEPGRVPCRRQVPHVFLLSIQHAVPGQGVRLPHRIRVERESRGLGARRRAGRHRRLGGRVGFRDDQLSPCLRGRRQDLHGLSRKPGRKARLRPGGAGRRPREGGNRMRWKKLGRIFDPGKFKLPNGCVGFAQSPQALLFEDFVRIYFSTRAVDARGKYISHIAYVDMEKNLHDVRAVAQRCVIEPGKLGCFDEHGIFPMNVVRRGELVYGYTCGWSRRVSVSVETAVGLAISRDGGFTFQMIGDGPVLAVSIHEPCLVGDGFVKIIGDRFHMWYIFGTGWKRFAPHETPDRTYKIGHAVSGDGINWVKEEARQIIEDRLGPDESQALPTVVEIAGRYHMFFCYRQSYDFRRNKERGYRIGHAYSDDLQNWTRDDANPGINVTEGEWDSDMLCYPHAFECDGRVYLLYNGNEFGRHGFGLAQLE